MGLMERVSGRIAAVLVLLALVLAPVADTATHGPAVAVAEADHAALHVGEGHPDGHGQGPHDATDHDHSASVILSAAPVLALPQGKSRWSVRMRDFADIRTDGPRRPPRV